ncbi:MAG: hypothetical protein AAF939_21745, partial [Planctomycetota bacterium]
RLQTKQLQSKFLVESGLDYTRLFLSQNENTIREKGGRWDNELTFSGIPVAVQTTQADQIGYFTVIAPNLNADGNLEGFRYGLIDESSKLNINALIYIDALYQNGRDILLGLPDMNEEIADAILDWLDADDDTRDYGTESAYYQSESPPYSAKNGPAGTINELLMVRGVTPQLLFGLDTNQNGVVDSEELQSSEASSIEPEMYLGWANYITLYSKESNLTSEGLPRININSDDLDQLYDDLKSAFNDEWANFIIYYRTADPAEPPVEVPPDGATESNAGLFPPDLTAQSQRKFQSVLDLVGVFVKTNDDENLFPYAPSPIRLDNAPFTLPTLMASLTTYEGTTIPGRLNIMEAPKILLAALPGMDEALAEEIISARGDDYELDDPDGADLNRRYETWLWAEAIVDLETMKGLMPYICARGDVYRAEIVGYFADGAGISRADAVFDTTEPIPRILSSLDKSHLRTSLSVETLGLNLAE